MVRFFFIAVVLCVSASANLHDKIVNFMSARDYAKQENLIKVLFRNEHDFYKTDGTEVDSLKVIKVLKDNGLFKLFYNSPISLHIKFTTEKNPLIFMKVIRESLGAIGYNYFLTTRATKNSDGFIWIINLKTRHLVNPLSFSEELQERGCSVMDIKKEDRYLWSYKIDSTNVKLNAKNIENDISVRLKKPIEPYLIYTNNSKNIKIKASLSDHWYPYVIFFDKALHVISLKKINDRTLSLKLDIPEGCKYIRIGDMYTLDNIKHGLSLYLKSEK